MPVGVTVSSGITKARKLFITAARAVGEPQRVMAKLVKRVDLPDGNGATYNIPWFGAYEASSLTEGVAIANPQKITDNGQAITTSEMGVQFIITKKAQRQASESLYAIAGTAGGNAIYRKEDADLLTLAGTFSVTIGGSGNTLVGGHISAGVNGIRVGKAGTTRTGALTAGDPYDGPIFTVVHPYSVHDLNSQFSGLGPGGPGNTTAIGSTAATINFGGVPVNGGMQENIIRKGFTGNLFGSDLYYDGNVPFSSTDAVGAIFGREAIWEVVFSPINIDQEPDIELRAINWVATMDIGSAIHSDAWGRRLLTDATAPAA